MKTNSNSPALKINSSMFCAASVSLLMWLLAISPASAALKTWDGTSSGNWGTSANWTPAAAPVDGDDLSFPAGALNPLNTNNITDLRVASITFSGGAGGYFLTGNAITVSNGVTSANTAGDNDLNFAFITNAASQTYTVDSGGTLDVNANIVLIGGFTLTVNNDFNARLDGAISGTGNIIKSSAGTGTLIMGGTAANTYVGTTTVNAGTLQLNVSVASGAIPGNLVIGNGSGTDTVELLAANQINNSSDITINVGGVLDANTFVEVVNDITMTGGSIIGSGSVLQMSGNMTVNASTAGSTITKPLFLSSVRSFTVADGAAITDLSISGAISSGGGINKLGPGRMLLSASNTYSGLTLVSEGVLALDDDFALGSTGAGTIISNGGTLFFEFGVLSLPEVLTLNGNGSTSQGALYSIGIANIVTNVVLGSDTTVNIATNGLSPADTTVDGGISGTGNLTKIGVGTLTFAGSPGNTYAGDTIVNEGKLSLAKSTLFAIPQTHNLIIGDGVGGVGADEVEYAGNNMINSSSDIIINSSGLLDLNGFSDTLGVLTLNSGDITTGSGTLTMNANLTATSSTLGGSATISGNLNLGAATRTFTVTNGTSTFDLSINASVSGSGGITKAEAGRMSLSSSNSYTGATTVNDGVLELENDFAAGTTAGGVTVRGDAVLQLNTGIHVGTEALTLNSTSTAGALSGLFGSNSWAGTITLSTDAFAFVDPGDTLNLLGSIDGAGGLTKIGTGTLYYSGATANTYAGVTTVNSGTLALEKSIFDGAVPGNLVIGDGAGGVNADMVRILDFNQIANTSDVTINSSGLLELAGFFEGIDELSGNGNVLLSGNDLYPGYGDGTSTFDGVISGIGDVRKNGTGTLTLNGTNTYTGLTIITEGSLIVNGSQPQSPVTVSASGILGGSGTVGIILNTAGGVVAPGVSPGVLTCSNVSFSGVSSDFNVELNGATPGSGHDQLNVRGTNSLGNCTLNVSVSGGFLPVEGVPLVILNNNASDAITGTFNGLPEGEIKTIGNFDFLISYQGGSGNDVTLTLTNSGTLKPGAATVFSGNGNGVIEVNECNLLSLVVSNLDGSAMTGVSATLQSLTPGIAVVQPFSGYPDIPAGLRRTNNTLFQLSASPGFVCGTNVELQLEVASATHGTLHVPFSLPSGVTGTPVRFNNAANFAIPDSGSVTSTVAVVGIAGPVKKVTVSLHITHTTDEDLDVSLQSPDGTTINLTSDNGGTGDDYGTDCLDLQRTVFDDSAASSIVGQPVPFVGTFRPEQVLAVFNGKTGVDVNGTWRLIVADDTGGGLGTLRCWSLFISPTACTPAGGACELCPELTLTGATGPSSTTQSGYVNFTGIPSACGVPKVCPGTVAGGPFPSDNYVFQNGPSNACITVTLANQSPSVNMLVTAYTNGYNPANPDKCVNYLADGGNVVSVSNPSQAFSFNLSANAVFVVNVIGSATSPVAPYRLTVTGGDCRPVLNVAAADATQAALDWTTAAASYRLERTNNLTSASSNWQSIATVPLVVNSRFTVTNNVDGTNQFYRLVKP